VPTAPRAIFLDRDGTLIVHRPYLCDPDGVELLPGVRETLGRAISDGCLLFLFTNQSGVGRGYFTLREVNACNERMCELLQLPAPGFTETCIAPEAPDAPSVYRKPSPKFILEMIARYGLDPRRSWMVGDALSDMQAGLNAGIRTTLVNTLEADGAPAEVWRCANLPAFYARLSASE
jgi:D-glycero-D-manno-heptose 1,7-bisphosphate phosphatase